MALVKHPLELVQLDPDGMHWLHRCQVCRWSRLICEYVDGGRDAVMTAQYGHPPLAADGVHLVATYDRPPADQASDTVTPPDPQ